MHRALLLLLFAAPLSAQPAPTPAVRLHGETDAAQTRKRLAEGQTKLTGCKTAEAVDDLLRVLAESGDDLVQLPDGSHQPARRLIHRLLSGLPADALRALRDRIDEPAKKLLEAGKAARDPSCRYRLFFVWKFSSGNRRVHPAGQPACQTGGVNPLRYLRDKLFGRPPQDGQTANAVATYGGIRRSTEPLRDQIRADPTAFPYVGPLDLDNYGAETDEMRLAYLKYHRAEPAARAAIEGLVASIADMDVMLLPEDEDRPDDQRAAAFVDWTVQDTPHGWDGLVRKVLLPALLLGDSVTETVLRGTDHRDWAASGASSTASRRTRTTCGSSSTRSTGTWSASSTPSAGRPGTSRTR